NTHVSRGRKPPACAVERPARKAVAVSDRATGSTVVLQAPEHGTDTGKEFARIERFGQIVVGTDFKAQYSVGSVGNCRQHDDRHTRMTADILANFDTAFARKHDIENDQ